MVGRGPPKSPGAVQLRDEQGKEAREVTSTLINLVILTGKAIPWGSQERAAEERLSWLEPQIVRSLCELVRRLPCVVGAGDQVYGNASLRGTRQRLFEVHQRETTSAQLTTRLSQLTTTPARVLAAAWPRTTFITCCASCLHTPTSARCTFLLWRPRLSRVRCKDAKL